MSSATFVCVVFEDLPGRGMDPGKVGVDYLGSSRRGLKAFSSKSHHDTSLGVQVPVKPGGEILTVESSGIDCETRTLPIL